MHCFLIAEEELEIPHFTSASKAYKEELLR